MDQQLQDCHLAGCARLSLDLNAKRRMLQTTWVSDTFQRYLQTDKGVFLLVIPLGAR